MSGIVMTLFAILFSLWLLLHIISFRFLKSKKTNNNWFWILPAIILFLVIYPTIMSTLAKYDGFNIFLFGSISVILLFMLHFGGLKTKLSVLTLAALAVLAFNYFDENFTAGNCTAINSYGQSYQTVCSDLDIVDIYDPKCSSYHCYSVVSELCDTRLNPNCSIENAYNKMLNRADRLAPTNDKKPVKNDCRVVMLDNVPWWFNFLNTNPVKVKKLEQSNSIINYTLKGHMFHPGKVHRKIYQAGSKVYVQTMGEGEGKLKWLNNNNLYMNAIWKPVDKRLKKSI